MLSSEDKIKSKISNIVKDFVLEIEKLRNENQYLRSENQSLIEELVEE